MPAVSDSETAAEFSPDRHRRDGLSSKCKACDRLLSRACYEENRAKRAAYAAGRRGEAKEARDAIRAMAVLAQTAAALPYDPDTAAQVARLRQRDGRRGF